MFNLPAHLSSGEVDYITSACNRNVRFDGRQALEYRPYTLEVNVIPTANGSARLRVEYGNILAVIKLTIQNITSAFRAEDVVKTSVSIHSISSQAEPELPTLLSSLSTQIKSFFLQSSLITKNMLTIIPNQQTWVLNVDITVFSHVGNIFDHAMLAARAAFATATIPALKVQRKFIPAKLPTKSSLSSSTSTSSTTIVLNSNQLASTDAIEYSIELIPGGVVPLGVWDQYIPLPLSLCVIGKTFIIDPAECEEGCVTTRYITAFDRTGALVIHSKAGVGGSSPELFIESVNIAENLALETYASYTRALNEAVRKDQKISKLMVELYQTIGKDCPLPDFVQQNDDIQIQDEEQSDQEDSQ